MAKSDYYFNTAAHANHAPPLAKRRIVLIKIGAH
jgi:hypothetical protein